MVHVSGVCYYYAKKYIFLFFIANFFFTKNYNKKYYNTFFLFAHT